MFEVQEILFHGGSEHTIDGKRYDLEMHVVHKDMDGDLDRPYAIIAVLFAVGETNNFFDSFIENEEFEWDTLFDDEILEYYHYEGSFTTPGCEQKVNWYIWNEIQEASQEQIDYLSGATDGMGEKVAAWQETYRETQSLNWRSVYQWGDPVQVAHRRTRDRESL